MYLPVPKSIRICDWSWRKDDFARALSTTAMIFTFQTKRFFIRIHYKSVVIFSTFNKKISIWVSMFWCRPKTSRWNIPKSFLKAQIGPTALERPSSAASISTRPKSLNIVFMEVQLCCHSQKLEKRASTCAGSLNSVGQISYYPGFSHYQLLDIQSNLCKVLKNLSTTFKNSSHLPATDIIAGPESFANGFQIREAAGEKILQQCLCKV